MKPKYSTSTDPKAKKQGRDSPQSKRSFSVGTLSQNQERIEEEKNKTPTTRRQEYIQELRRRCKLVITNRKKTLAPPSLDDIIPQTAARIAESKAMRTQAKKRVYNKGAMQSKHGFYTDNIVMSARAQMLLLDENARPMGKGEFVEGKPGEPGKFVPDHSIPPTEKINYDVKPPKHADAFWWDKLLYPEGAPVCHTSQFVKYGRSKTWPGIDASFAYMTVHTPIEDRNKAIGLDQYWNLWRGSGETSFADAFKMLRRKMVFGIPLEK